MQTVPKDNPFPGIDPWMQSVWHDVHHMLLGYIRDQLGSGLPDDLVARAEESIVISSSAEQDRRWIPDVTVSAASESWKSGQPPAWKEDEDGSILVELESVASPDETAKWIEIRTASGDRLVTAIEILSPSNKTAQGRAAFDQKVLDLLRADANVVEIDLVQGGRKRAFSEDALSCGPGSNHIFVMTPDQTNLAHVYQCPLREPLPAITIPLRPDEKGIKLELQPLLDRCYRNGRYWAIDRSQVPEYLHEGQDRAWAEEEWKRNCPDSREAP